MGKTRLLLLTLACVLGLACGNAQTSQFKLFQINTWYEGDKVTNSYLYLANAIADMNPDVVTMCELHKGSNKIIDYLQKQLKSRGLNYYQAQVSGRGVLSKYPIAQTVTVNQWMFGVVLQYNDTTKIAVYPAHSEYRWYSCYYPRGYGDGGVLSWDMMSKPITDVNKILEVNAKSDRVTSAKTFVNTSASQLAANIPVILAGDLNEPSCLDWTERQKDLYGHNGCVVPWQTSTYLLGEGFSDAYRVVHPDEIKNPGITRPTYNKKAKLEDLAWAAEADARDRIDYVYYKSTAKNTLKAVDAKVVGPAGTIVCGEGEDDAPTDDLVRYELWPSDHRGVLVTFELNADNSGVTAVRADKTVAHTSYYDMNGKRVANPQQGMYVEVARYTDGTIGARKVAK